MRAVSDDTFAALTILAESAGEPYNGQIAIGEVIRNRMERRFFSDGTVIGTCFAPKQFSVWNDDAQDRALAIRTLQTDLVSNPFQKALAAWRESAMATSVPDCVAYFNPSIVIPTWLGDFTVVCSIGHHEFLKRK